MEQVYSDRLPNKPPHMEVNSFVSFRVAQRNY